MAGVAGAGARARDRSGPGPGGQRRPDSGRATANATGSSPSVAPTARAPRSRPSKRCCWPWASPSARSPRHTCCVTTSVSMWRAAKPPMPNWSTAFERIEAARGATTLTFFEYNTLAALLLFADQQVDVAVLEVGLGGRLDAVNLVDADVACCVRWALITVTGWAIRSRPSARKRPGYSAAATRRCWARHRCPTQCLCRHRAAGRTAGDRRTPLQLEIDRPGRRLDLSRPARGSSPACPRRGCRRHPVSQCRHRPGRGRSAGRCCRPAVARRAAQPRGHCRGAAAGAAGRALPGHQRCRWSGYSMCRTTSRRPRL